MGRGTRSGAVRQRGDVAGVTVAALDAALAEIAPYELAEEWDNVGVLVGSGDWPAARVLVALDLTDTVAQEALKKEVDALVLYHPPIFKPLKRITPEAAGPTRLFPELLANRIALLATHTALDAAPGGTNDQILDWFDVAERYPLETRAAEAREYKLVVFVPPAEVEGLRAALSAVGAGQIGNYSECSYELRGRGSFKGDESTNPTIGERERLEFVEEVRLEMVVPRSALGAVVRALYRAHSYEEPAFDVYPLVDVAGRGATGMGRVGELKRKTAGRKLADTLAEQVDLAGAQVVGGLSKSFARVVAAAGAFGVARFRDPESLYLTGEFKHHDALELQRRGITCVMLGHHHSEVHVLPYLRDRLKHALPGAKVEIARGTSPPLQPLRS